MLSGTAPEAAGRPRIQPFIKGNRSGVAGTGGEVASLVAGDRVMSHSLPLRAQGAWAEWLSPLPRTWQWSRRRCRSKLPLPCLFRALTANQVLRGALGPPAAINDVVVQVHAAGFTSGELTWPSTWTDRRDRDRTPTIPGHELAGVVSALGYGTTGLSVGQRVFGLADWHRDGTLAEYVAIEARNLAPLPGDIDFTVGASLPISGLTAWQGLFDHSRLQPGQCALVPGAAGAVGTMVAQLAREFGAYVISHLRLLHTAAAPGALRPSMIV